MIAAEEVLKKDEESLEKRASELEGVLGKRPEALVTTTGDTTSVMQSDAEEGGEPTLVVVGSRGLGTVAFRSGQRLHGCVRTVSAPVLIVSSSKEEPR